MVGEEGEGECGGGGEVRGNGEGDGTGREGRFGVQRDYGTLR